MGKREAERVTLRCLQNFKVVIFRAADHLSQRHLSACLKNAHLGATPRLPLTEYQELGLGNMYFNQHISQLILVHPRV